MPKILRLVLFLVLALSLRAEPRNIGEIEVEGEKAIPVRVSANTPELTALAQRAFDVHGCYKVVSSGQFYDIKFTQLAPTQVRVDIAKGKAGTVVSSDVATGTNAHNALLRAADIAVVKTNGAGLKGFFTARLAFIRDLGRAKEVCVSDLFFTESRQITRDNAAALTPRWSPDGSRILYTSYYKSGFPDIFQLDLNTSQRTTFVSFRGTNSGAHFSPNGQHVAMVLSGSGNPEIWVSNAQGRAPERRTRSDAVKSSPCYSPDGSRIIFAMEPGPQLYVMSAMGGAPQRLTTGFGYAAEPDWSAAKPNRVACTVRVGTRYQIAVYDFSTGKAEVVSKAAFDGIEPSWLPDGRHLVYTARDASHSQVCILDTETGKSSTISPISLGSASQASVWAP